MGKQPATDQADTITIPDDARPFLRWADDPNMTCRQAAILAIVTANPGLTVGAVATVMGIPKPSVTRTADKLEDWGLLIRSQHPGDRRLVEMFAAKVKGKAAPARTGQSTRRGG
jgi:DNA-binding MarR family transcriptional regulator